MAGDSIPDFQAKKNNGTNSNMQDADVEAEDAVSSNGLHSHHDPASSPPIAGRGRSQSVAAPNASVETVIVKAKRAASILWMLLHAQVRKTEHRTMSSTVENIQLTFCLYAFTELCSRWKVPLSRLQRSKATASAFENLFRRRRDQLSYCLQGL